MVWQVHADTGDQSTGLQQPSEEAHSTTRRETDLLRMKALFLPSRSSKFHWTSNSDRSRSATVERLLKTDIDGEVIPGCI
jgi:hypothetical protein